ncbi:DUF3016 domain-containing protein [Rheinheimera sp.]|uniref:DUF3016 domain-containing protein n=1 Tax=Rheinheimera sp. TaxID=1869214 RepID=UPI00307DC1DD
MRKLNFALIGMVFCLATAAQAADIKVEYVDQKKFTDIKPSNEPKGSFEKRTLAGFDKIFADLAAKLPEGYLWKVKVTDIDLAGDVNYMFTQTGQDIRVIKEIFSPRINFSYELLDSQQKVVLSEELKLRDMAFMSRSHLNRSQALSYEREMLERWFKDKFEPAFAAATASSSTAG